MSSDQRPWVYGIVNTAAAGWTHPVTVTALALAIIVLAAFVVTRAVH